MNEAGKESPFPASAGSGTASSSASGTASGLGGTLGSGSSHTAGQAAGQAASHLHEAAADTARAARSAQDAVEGGVHRMAQRAHEAVDRLEETLGAGSERMLDWQQEYSDMAREQVRASPLAALGIAFAVGIVFSKLFMR